MPRRKSYDRQNAIEKACMAFWAHGYQALGVRELERLTGLNQFAIRTEFGGKEGLYLEALEYYCNAAISSAMTPLKTGGLAEIIFFLRNLVTDGSMTSSAWGCLIVNTGIENARIGSEKLDTAVSSYWKTLESHFRCALGNAHASGEVAPETDLDSVAKGLVAAVMGVHAQNRSSLSNTGGCDLVELISAHLNSLRAS